MEQETKPSSAGVAVAAAVLVLTVLGAPLLYVASIGPAIALAEKGIISDEENSPAGKFSIPLTFAHENCKPFGDALDWYVELWESP